MNPAASDFPPVAFVKARLFRAPIYREDTEDWLTLRGHVDEIQRTFRDIGQQLVLDEAEGYAFIRQLEPEGEERVPRLVQRRPLSYPATLLLVVLREEFLRFDSAADDSPRLILTREQLRDLVADFFPETTNQVRDFKLIDAAIKSLDDLGFVRPLAAGGQDAFEIMRIVKARIAPAELETIKKRLLDHAEPGN